jgi:signal transduction histidine kinase
MKWRWLVEWGALFVLLVLAIWAATQSRDAPLLILLAALYVITINFSLPPAQSGVGLVPVVAVSSFLVMGLPTAVTLLLIGTLLAELARPIWKPLWETAPEPTTSNSPPLRQRFTAALIHLLALLIGGFAYQQAGGVAPLTPETLENVTADLALIVTFGTAYFGLMALWWALRRQPLAAFFRVAALPVLTAGVLALPFALFGGVTFALGGLPPFVIFCLGTAVFSVSIWLSWQRRTHLEQQLRQFAILNHSGHSLRETLELPEVLGRAHQLVTELVAVDEFAIHLQESGNWYTYCVVRSAYSDEPRTTHYALRTTALDDFTTWVAHNGRPLHLDSRNLHFAARHGLAPPQPMPAIWLGLPLSSGDEVMGVMVLQRVEGVRPFTRWNQELLRAVAAQVSAAIHNARLHSEIVRLYNLTDEALAGQVQQLQALLNAMTEGVMMIDREGVVRLVNPTAAHLLGEQAPRPGQPLATAVAPALGYDAPTIAARLLELRYGRPQWGYGRIRYHLPDTRRMIERQESVVFDRDDRLIGWLLLFRDVTEEHELAEQREELSRMIVHDLRNPLTTIATTMQMAQERLPANGEINTLLQDAHTGSLDLLDMVDSLMDINRMEAGQSIVDAEAMRLPPLAQQVVNRLQPLLAHKQISLTLAAPADLPAIWADAELVRRVLVNLLDNALKFTPGHGRIHITLQPEPAANGHEAGVRCIILDSGPGIPPEFREQAFYRYTRTNPGGAQVRGAGLGLTFCKMAIEAQHGRIWLEDAPKGGTQFVFTLPGIPVFA